MYASFLGSSEALHMDIFHQPLRSGLLHNLLRNYAEFALFDFCPVEAEAVRDDRYAAHGHGQCGQDGMELSQG
jgi:hypothetical protein